jgi:tRNA(Arg) A34 adenosine deaminase TadA
MGHHCSLPSSYQNNDRFLSILSHITIHSAASSGFPGRGFMTLDNISLFLLHSAIVENKFNMPGVSMNETDLFFLRRTFEVALRSRANGNHPFGALLVDENQQVLVEAENGSVTQNDCTAHAETVAIRLGSQRYGLEKLAKCTLYTNAEPCAMCSGAIHWGHVGRVVYALSEVHLLEITGQHAENPTMHLPCRTVFAHCDQPVEVLGPALEDEARVVHEGFWQ